VSSMYNSRGLLTRLLLVTVVLVLALSMLAVGLVPR